MEIKYTDYYNSLTLFYSINLNDQYAKHNVIFLLVFRMLQQ